MKELRVRQISLFFIAILPLSKMFVLPSIMVEHTKEDLWISSLINSLLDLATIIALVFACKKFGNKGFYTLLQENFGKTIAKIFLALYFVFFMARAYIPLIEQESYIELTLYETSSTRTMFLPIFIISFYLALKPLRTIGRCVDVLWFITVVSLAILFTIAFTKIDFSAILPIGAAGSYNIFKCAYLTTPWFTDCVYVLFLLGEFKYEKLTLTKIVIGYALASIFVIFILIIFYGIFSTTAERQLFALSEVSNYSTVISNIERFDYIAIFGILFSNVFSLALPLYFATYCLQKICEFKNKIIPSLITNGVAFLSVLFFHKYIHAIQAVIQNYFSLYFILLGNVIPILILLLPRRNKNESLSF